MSALSHRCRCRRLAGALAALVGTAALIIAVRPSVGLAQHPLPLYAISPFRLAEQNPSIVRGLAQASHLQKLVASKLPQRAVVADWSSTTPIGVPDCGRYPACEVVIVEETGTEGHLDYTMFIFSPLPEFHLCGNVQTIGFCEGGFDKCRLRLRGLLADHVLRHDESQHRRRHP